MKEFRNLLEKRGFMVRFISGLVFGFGGEAGKALKGKDYRVPEGMPYVRREYIHGAPQPKITKFTMGNPKGDFSYRVSLLPLKKVQIRHNALEALRVTVNKQLADKLGGENYCLRIKAYPHVVLRENKMMAFAGADRLQEGMRRAFGKAVGLAARVEAGRPVVEVEVKAEGIEVAKRALKIGASKLPTPCTIQIAPLQRG